MGKRGRKPNEIDWTPIKTEYVTTNCGHRELAEKYGVSRTAIGLKCSAEGWVEERKKYKERVVTRVCRKSANREVDRLARLIGATTKAIDVAVEAFEDDKQFNRYIVTENVGGGATETTEQVFAKVDTKALKDLTSVLKDLTGLMRDFYNIPTPAQAEAQRIAAERLELDKMKASADQVDNTIEVVIGGEAEEWAK